jgi:glycosyltransferase involved in cell wall biosynthesis
MLCHLKERCEVEVIAPLDRSFRYFYLGHKLAEKVRGSKIEIDREPLALRSYRDQIMQRIDRSAVDIVFAPSSVPIAMLDGNVPVVFWGDAVWGGMVGYYEGFSHYSSRTLVNGHRQEQMALDRVAAAIYASEWAASTVRKHYQVKPSKVGVIPFGANLESKHDLEGMRAVLRRRNKDLCRLLFLGVDWERKGGELALQVADLLNLAGLPTTLTVVGCDPFRGIEKPFFVENLGFISKKSDAGRKQLEDLLRVSNFLILPTRAEAAGIVFCEASAFGLPILAPDTGGVSTYVHHGVNGRLFPLEATANDYANEILRIFGDERQYEQMCLASFNEFKTRLNWGTAVKSLTDVLAGCVKQSA